MALSSDLSASDVAVLTGNTANNDMFGGNGAWWIIILFLFAFAGGWNNGFGGNGSGASDNYVLASDFATIQRQLSDGFGGVEKGLDTIRNGLCDGFYTQAQLSNQTNTNIMQSANALQAQLASCCCDIREGISGINYNMAMGNNQIQQAISNGFCQTNYNMATQNAQTMQAIDKVGDRVIDYLANKENQNLRDENFALRLSASQQAQNNYLVQELGQKCAVPSYLVANPNGSLNYNFGCNGCGC